jgi:predicted peptidase
VVVRNVAGRALLKLVILAAPAASAGGRSVETGFLNRSLVLDGTGFRYQVSVLREFHRATTWPVILALHGDGDDGDNGLRQTDHALASVTRRFPERVPAIVISPEVHADGTPGWQQAGGRAALAAVEWAIAECSGDHSRVCLTGWSAGGDGTRYLV